MVYNHCRIHDTVTMFLLPIYLLFIVPTVVEPADIGAVLPFMYINLGDGLVIDRNVDVAVEYYIQNDKLDALHAVCRLFDRPNVLFIIGASGPDYSITAPVIRHAGAVNFVKSDQDLFGFFSFLVVALFMVERVYRVAYLDSPVLVIFCEDHSDLAKASDVIKKFTTRVENPQIFVKTENNMEAGNLFDNFQSTIYYLKMVTENEGELIGKQKDPTLNLTDPIPTGYNCFQKYSTSDQHRLSQNRLSGELSVLKSKIFDQNAHVEIVTKDASTAKETVLARWSPQTKLSIIDAVWFVSTLYRTTKHGIELLRNRSKLAGRELKVLIDFKYPFIIHFNRSASVNDLQITDLEGFTVDLLSKLQSELNFTIKVEYRAKLNHSDQQEMELQLWRILQEKVFIFHKVVCQTWKDEIMSRLHKYSIFQAECIKFELYILFNPLSSLTLLTHVLLVDSGAPEPDIPTVDHMEVVHSPWDNEEDSYDEEL